jgi:mRNA interferase RelE/StbE
VTYRVELRQAPVRALRKIDPHDRGRIQGAIAPLAHDPRPPGAKSVQGRPRLRVRVGDYRIIYTIEGDVLLVVVVTIRHRSGIYRTLSEDGAVVAPERAPLKGTTSSQRIVRGWPAVGAAPR